MFVIISIMVGKEIYYMGRIFGHPSAMDFFLTALVAVTCTVGSHSSSLTGIYSHSPCDANPDQ